MTPSLWLDAQARYTTMKPMNKVSIHDTGYSSTSVRVLGSTELASVQSGLVSTFHVVTPASDYDPDIVEINRGPTSTW